MAPQVILTCFHLLPDASTADESTFELDYQQGENGAFGNITSVKLRPDVCFVADKALDFAIVALESALPDRPTIPLAVDGNAVAGEGLSLFHHPHGGPLQIALKGGTIVAVKGSFLHHDVDTMAGSAGAPLLDERFRLIGLHHAAVPADGHRFSLINEAVRATAILAAIQQQRIPEQLGVFSRTGDDLRPIRARREPSSPESRTASEVANANSPVVRGSIFISYARADQGKRKWRERLNIFLAPFRQELDVWDDSRIETGAEWRTEIDIALKRARVAVLLIGPSFLGSEFIAENELPPLLDASAKEGVAVLPLITNYCSFERTALSKYQAFNDPKKPLERMGISQQNQYLKGFAEAIVDAFKKLQVDSNST